MPIDPRIPLGVQAPQFANPLEQLSTIAQMQGLREQAELRRLAAQEAREKRTKQAAIDQALQAAIKIDDATGRITFDKKSLVAHLPGDLAYKAQQELDADEVTANKLAESVLDLEGKRRDYRGSIARTIKAAGYDQKMFRSLMLGAQGFGAIDDDTAARYAALEDPAQIQAVVDDHIAQTTKDTDVVQVQTVDEQGKPVTKFVRKEAGMSYPAAPEKPPNIGSFEDYVVRRFGPTPTAPQIAQAHKDWQPPTPAGLQLLSVVGPDGKAMYVPEAQAIGMQPGSTATGGTRPVTSGDAGRIAELDPSRDDLAALSATLSQAGATGTIAAAGAAMPKWVTDLTGWGEDAKKKQALIDRVKQVIGKALEGGVLRKEDEVKYEKILPTIGDPPAIVISKLQGLDAAIAQRRSTHLDALADAGYDTSRFLARTPRPPVGTTPDLGKTPATPDLTGLPKGRGRRFTAGPFAGQTWALDDKGTPYRVQ